MKQSQIGIFSCFKCSQTWGINEGFLVWRFLLQVERCILDLHVDIHSEALWWMMLPALCQLLWQHQENCLAERKLNPCHLSTGVTTTSHNFQPFQLAEETLAVVINIGFSVEIWYPSNQRQRASKHTACLMYWDWIGLIGWVDGSRKKEIIPSHLRFVVFWQAVATWLYCHCTHGCEGFPKDHFNRLDADKAWWYNCDKVIAPKTTNETNLVKPLTVQRINLRAEIVWKGRNVFLKKSGWVM